MFRMSGAGVRIPSLPAMMPIGWMQVVFFGPTMLWAEPRGALVLPYQGARLVTLAFWLVAASVFGLLAQRLRSRAALFVSAVTFVAGTAFAVRAVAPLFN
jgi:hypothetical protein